MSDYFIVNTVNHKGDESKVLIKCDWIIEVSESVNKGAYIVLAEDNAVSCNESIDDVVKMINSKSKVACIKKKKATKQKTDKIMMVLK